MRWPYNCPRCKRHKPAHHEICLMCILDLGLRFAPPGLYIPLEMPERLARDFAVVKHRKQVRKYTGEPYIFHPYGVVKIVKLVKGNSLAVASAAWLHDTVEDCKCTLNEVESYFGEAIAKLVEELTDVSKPSDGNRARRKAIDLEHLASASPEAQTIKLADLLHNTSSIVVHDPGFARVYLREKEALLRVLTQGDPGLQCACQEILESSWRTLGRVG